MEEDETEDEEEEEEKEEEDGFAGPADAVDLSFLAAFCRGSPPSPNLEIEWNLFLTSLSVLPGHALLAISAHLFPTNRWCSRSLSSSSFVQPPFTTSGLRWFTYRSRHCFPLRGRPPVVELLKARPMTVQLREP